MRSNCFPLSVSTMRNRSGIVVLITTIRSNVAPHTPQCRASSCTDLPERPAV